jgi:hypothetical protein
MLNLNKFTKTLTGVVNNAANVVSKAADAAKDLAEDSIAAASGTKALRDYRLLDQVAVAGPQGIWKIYAAKARKSSM